METNEKSISRMDFRCWDDSSFTSKQLGQGFLPEEHEKFLCWPFLVNVRFPLEQNPELLQHDFLGWCIKLQHVCCKWVSLEVYQTFTVDKSFTENSRSLEKNLALITISFNMATLIWVHIGSGNSLLPDGTKPFPKPMLTHNQQGSVASEWRHFLKICSYWTVNTKSIFVLTRGQFWPLGIVVDCLCVCVCVCQSVTSLSVR